MALDQPCPSSAGGEIILVEQAITCDEDESEKEHDMNPNYYYNSLSERRKGGKINAIVVG